MRYTYKQLADKYELLPEEIKEAIDNTDEADILGKIGDKYNLHIDEIGKLADLVIAVLYGFERPANFISLIRQELGLSELKAGDIGYEIDAQIFAPIRQSIHDLYEHPPQPKLVVPEGLPGQEEYHNEATHAPAFSTMPSAPNTPTDTFPIHRPMTPNPQPSTPQPAPSPASRIGNSDPYRETIE